MNQRTEGDQCTRYEPLGCYLDNPAQGIVYSCILFHTMHFEGVCDGGCSLPVADHRKPDHSHLQRYVAMNVSDCTSPKHSVDSFGLFTSLQCIFKFKWQLKAQGTDLVIIQVFFLLLFSFCICICCTKAGPA